MITKRIEKAIDIFLDAINEGTLAKGTCAACAVGNLVGYEIGYKPSVEIAIKCGYQPTNGWPGAIKGMDGESQGKELLLKTDFTIKELHAIEDAFETATKITFGYYPFRTKEEIRADQIRGLEAVVKVMLEFDDCKEEVTEVFTKRADLIPV